MNDETAELLPMNDDDLIIQCEMVFQKKPKLLASGTNAFGNTPGSELYADIPDTLMDSIKWEPHIAKANRLDYIVAVSSGALAGLIDTLWVKEFSLDRASEWGSEKIEKVVMKVAHMEGYSGDNLNDAIRTLEINHPFASDGNTNDFGGGLQHHLRDFSHHFSVGGLFFSILTQLTGLVIGADKEGTLHIVPVPQSHEACIGKNLQERIVFGTIGWFFHMVSDMAGSSGSLMGGTGIPGPLISLMKELSVLPFFKNAGDDDMSFRLWVTKLFNGTYLADHDETGKIIKESIKKFDLRMEIGILGEINRQTLPVLIDQCMVRGFYFCRRLISEIKALEIRGIADLGRIAPESILPWGTPVMRRMVTISSGIFTTTDIAHAAVQTLKSKEPVTFFLHINYVGIATFAVACIADTNAALEAKKLDRGESYTETYERQLSNLGRLKLNHLQARILHSIEHAIIVYDITNEKHPKLAKRKRVWLEEWEEKVIDTIGCVWAADEDYFMSNDVLYSSIEEGLENDKSDSWLWLEAIEAMRFRPYTSLYGDNDNLYKGLKLASDYLDEVFCNRQQVIGRKGLAKLDKQVEKTKSILDGTTTRRVARSVGTVAAVAASGGIAFYFAPAIAPALAATLGFEAATLHGAALASASLAFLGGGALAAGGTGISGGTMLIAGGGAILGAIGSSGITAAMSMALATNGNYMLEECAKLTIFCKEILIKRYGDLTSVAKINTVLNQRIVELEVKIEALKLGLPDNEILEDDDGIDHRDDISPKVMIRILNRSHKLMRCTSDELVKALKTSRKKQTAIQADK